MYEDDYIVKKIGDRASFTPVEDKDSKFNF